MIAPSILLCADFDETITLQDTISLLFQLASCSASTQQQLEEQYMKEMSEFLDQYEAKWLHAPTTGQGSFNGTGLREFLEGYAATDLRSLKRVINCRALQGICHQTIVEAAKTVEIRPHCAETLAAVDEWKIVSANWCKKLVSSVLTQSGVVTDNNIRQSTHIIANELKVNKQGVTTGKIDVKVQSPLDKAQWINQVRSLYTGIRPIVIYVGDSVNDLLALLEADVGIWLDSDSSSSSSQLLRQLVENYGIDVQPLKAYTTFAHDVATTSDDGDSKPVIYTATDWVQLKELVDKRFQN
ncbi:unnamed protein product [Peronospora belbahrii]|uniref:Sucrose phosphatase-like domain-containing protein n=1 Tax=Peronospora belbahrii TaxID=622444 RepID=A0AAU9L9U8_9STRA|nr:unnamed protein product [Peronospora belbahrii]